MEQHAVVQLPAKEVARRTLRGVAEYVTSHARRFFGLDLEPKRALGIIVGPDAFVVPAVMGEVCATLGLEQSDALAALRQLGRLKTEPGSESFVSCHYLPPAPNPRAIKERGYYLLGVFDAAELAKLTGAPAPAALRGNVRTVKAVGSTMADAAIPSLYKQKKELAVLHAATGRSYGAIVARLQQQKLVPPGAPGPRPELAGILTKGLQLQAIAFVDWCAYYGFDPTAAAAAFASKAPTLADLTMLRALAADFPAVYQLPAKLATPLAIVPKQGAPAATAVPDQAPQPAPATAAPAGLAKPAVVEPYLRDQQVAQATKLHRAGGALFAIATELGELPGDVYRALVAADVVPRLANAEPVTGRLARRMRELFFSARLTLHEWSNYYGLDPQQVAVTLGELRLRLKQPEAEQDRVIACLAGDFAGLIAACRPRRNRSTPAAAPAPVPTSATAKEPAPPAESRPAAAARLYAQKLGLRQLATELDIQPVYAYRLAYQAGCIAADSTRRSISAAATLRLPVAARQALADERLLFGQWCMYYGYHLLDAATALAAGTPDPTGITARFQADFPAWRPTKPTSDQAGSPETEVAEVSAAAGSVASDAKSISASALAGYRTGLGMRELAACEKVSLQMLLVRLRQEGAMPRRDPEVRGVKKLMPAWPTPPAVRDLLRKEHLSIGQWVTYYRFNPDDVVRAFATDVGSEPIVAAFCRDFPAYQPSGDQEPAPVATPPARTTAGVESAGAGIAPAGVPALRVRQTAAAEPARTEEFAIAWSAADNAYVASLVRVPGVTGKGATWGAAVAALEQLIREIRALAL